jgi:CrcB protein
MLFLMIAAGGAFGAVARYGLSGMVQSLMNTAFPAGTLVVNSLGSILLGLSFHLLEGVGLSPEVRSLVTIGFLGAFTTFSTFSYESLVLLEGGEWGRAGVYMGGSVALGILGVALGIILGSLILQARG